MPAGRAGASAAVETEAGRYDVLLGGEAYGHASVAIDGEEVGSVRGGVYPTGDYARLGSVDLSAGEHEIRLDYEGAGLHPGSAVRAKPLGPVLLDPVVKPDPAAMRVAAADYRRLERGRSGRRSARPQVASPSCYRLGSRRCRRWCTDRSASHRWRARS
jgi:hypothetical protein